MNKDELRKITTGRRNIVWALERITIWRELFTGGARLLLNLAEAENETWSNNASGVFVGLFSPGPGGVAPTEATPEERFPVLRNALESSSPEKRKVAFSACRQALESFHFHRTVGAEYQGLKKEPKLWEPKTYGELFDAYKRVWNLLVEKLETLPQEEQKEIIDILLNYTRGLLHMHNLTGMVIDTLKLLLNRQDVDSSEVLNKVLMILRYDKKEISEEASKQLEVIRDSIIGDSFGSRLKRYAGMDLLEDKVDLEGNPVDLAQGPLGQLAEQVIANIELLKPELSWLMTNEAQNGYRFGYELGKRDEGCLLLPILLEEQRRIGENSSVYFLGGYFNALRESNQDRWENELDEIATEKDLYLWLPELTWRSGTLTDRGALRILDLAEKGLIEISQFGMFAYGSVISNLSERVFKKWIKFMIERSSEGLIIAFDLYHFYYLQRKQKPKLPKALTLKLLLHKFFFEAGKEVQYGIMTIHDWADLGKAFIKEYPLVNLKIASKMLKYFGDDGTIVGGYEPSSLEVLNEIFRQNPEDVWKIIQKYLGPPIDSRAFRITHWINLQLVPQAKIWEWVDKDIGQRAWYIATFVPKVRGGWVSSDRKK